MFIPSCSLGYICLSGEMLLWAPGKNCRNTCTLEFLFQRRIRKFLISFRLYNVYLYPYVYIYIYDYIFHTIHCDIICVYMYIYNIYISYYMSFLFFICRPSSSSSAHTIYIQYFVFIPGGRRCAEDVRVYLSLAFISRFGWKCLEGNFGDQFICSQPHR